MTDKKRKSITFDPDNYDFLSNHDNASALVRDLVEKYRTDGNREKAALKLRREQKARELESAREEVERLESDLEEIDRLIHDVEQADETNLDEAAERLRGTELSRDNEAIKTWSGKLGLTPTELIDELEKRRS